MNRLPGSLQDVVFDAAEDAYERVTLFRDDTGEWWTVVRTASNGRGGSFVETAWHVNGDDPLVTLVEEAMASAQELP